MTSVGSSARLYPLSRANKLFFLVVIKIAYTRRRYYGAIAASARARNWQLATWGHGVWYMGERSGER